MNEYLKVSCRYIQNCKCASTTSCDKCTRNMCLLQLTDNYIPKLSGLIVATKDANISLLGDC